MGTGDLALPCLPLQAPAPTLDMCRRAAYEMPSSVWAWSRRYPLWDLTGDSGGQA